MSRFHGGLAAIRGRAASAAEILTPGRNCWRIEHASRVSLIVDAADYFLAVYEAFLSARHTIAVVGWDIDSRMQLVRDPSRIDHRLPTRLGPLLSALAQRRPRLHIHVLAWDFAPIFMLEREPLSRLRFKLGSPERVNFHLDDRHPPGGSQHQKLVVIDDAVAFCGGLDLCDVRWDTSEHRPNDPARVDVRGRPYRPHHDVEIGVAGPAAAALGELVRERWFTATGERMPDPVPDEDFDPWPRHLRPDFTDVPVAIARTAPELPTVAPCREVQTLWCDSIAAARRSIYIENPYVSSDLLERALAQRLSEPQGPEIIIVHPPKSNGFLENFFLRSLVDGVIHRLRRADVHRHLQVYSPYVIDPQSDERHGVNVHGKVCIVDDHFIRIGSANLANRSMRLDRECDLAVEASNARERGVIAGFRNRLIGEHVGVHPHHVASEYQRRGSLIRTIECLSSRNRKLEPYEPAKAEFAERLVVVRDVIDPPGPLSIQQIARLLMQDGRREQRWRWIGFAWWGVVIGLVLTARFTGLIDAQAVTTWLTEVGSNPTWGWGAVMASFVLTGLVLIPVTLMIANCGALFGVGLGTAYALLGAFTSAAVYYWLGRWMGRDLVHRFAGPRLHNATKAVARRGILAVAAVRLVPIAPHLVVGLAAGAARITFRDYMLGTMVAMVPGAVILVLAGARVAAGGPWWNAVGALGVLVVLGLVVAWLLQRWIGRGPAVHERLEAAGRGAD